jgi:hypothetical protein
MLCHHTGEKRMARRCTRSSLPNCFVSDVISFRMRGKHINVSNVKNQRFKIFIRSQGRIQDLWLGGRE